MNDAAAPGGSPPRKRRPTAPAVAPERRLAARVALIVLMTLVSLFLWIGVPLGWLWIAAQVSYDYQAIYLWALAAIPPTMVTVGWVLYRINRVYVRVSGEQSGPRQTKWLRSQAADRRSREPRRAIDVIMTCSVAIAATLMLIWFFFFAGSPLP
jgi:hypothetical protein